MFKFRISLILFITLSIYCSAIMERDGYPWNVKLKSSQDSEVPGWYLNLGPTGIRAQITQANPTQLQVKYVFQDAKSPLCDETLAGCIANTVCCHCERGNARRILWTARFPEHERISNCQPACKG